MEKINRFSVFLWRKNRKRSLHVGICPETAGQKLRKGGGFIAAVRTGQMDQKIIIAKFPHDLPAYAARGKTAGDHTVLAAADSNGGEIPVAVVDGFENGGALGAVGGAKGGVFNVAALVNCAVGTQKRSADLVAGVGGIGPEHGLLGQFNKLFGGHRITSKR